MSCIICKFDIKQEGKLVISCFCISSNKEPQAFDFTVIYLNMLSVYVYEFTPVIVIQYIA